MKILQNEMTGTQTSFPPNSVENWISSCLSFLRSASTAAATYIFSAPT